jgi:hypothetical protein
LIKIERRAPIAGEAMRRPLVSGGHGRTYPISGPDLLALRLSETGQIAVIQVKQFECFKSDHASQLASRSFERAAGDDEPQSSSKGNNSPEQLQQGGFRCGSYRGSRN